MSAAVVEVGPRSVRGAGSAPREWISVAIECIDDRLALLDGQLVEVSRLWGDLLEAVAGEHSETLVLVFPTWWSSGRIEVVTDAAGRLADEIVVRQRASTFGGDGVTTVVELSEELVVIAAPAAAVTVLPRRECENAAYLAGYLMVAIEVLIDVPDGVPAPSAELAARLRDGGIPVGYSDRHKTMCSVSAGVPDHALRESTGRLAPSRRRVAAVLVGAMAALAAVGGSWMAQMLSSRTPDDPSTVLLVEGRVAVRVPAQWTVKRITSGPGSARLRVSAPTGGPAALHLTQSMGAASATVDEVAATLRRALESEPPGVFADMDPAGSVGGRPAVTYRELRAGSETSWAVVIDGAIRVAIGCQSPPQRRDVIHEACVRAVKSVHVVR